MKASIVFLLAATAASATTPVWIDTDPSVARGGREVDDGLALIQAFRAKQLAVRGVSVVAGNAPVNEAFPIAKHLVRDFGPRGTAVFRGAAGASEIGVETEASRALAAALERERLTILMLGPATNVATALRNRPELADRIIRIIAVAGRRPNQTFSPAPAARPFRDFNFELDPAGFQLLLDSGVPLVLAPWEISSKIWMREADLQQLRASNPALGWVLDAAQDWLAFWKNKLGANGFNPFDTLAVGYAISKDSFRCEHLPVRIELHPDDTVPGAKAPNKPYLIAARGLNSRSSALYCSEAPRQFKQQLVMLLAKPVE